MNKLFTLMALVASCTAANAQNPPDKEPDTIRIGNIVITKNGNPNVEEGDGATHVTIGKHYHTKLSKVSTNWAILDLGYSNYDDQTDYNATEGYLYNRPGTTPISKTDFKLRTGKSINVNIWFFMQRLSLVDQYINLKYGLGLELNNYRYNVGVNLSYRENNPFVAAQPSAPIVFRDSIQFSKNKLAADYLTVPLMINFTSDHGYTNKGISLSMGVSFGYLYNSRNKQVSEERGKWKNEGDYDLEHFKLSYVAELGIGPVRLYGSYSPNSFYATGLNMKPYTFGIRLSTW